MSTNRLKNAKMRFEDLLVKKDLTPKSTRLSPKISPVYSSFRGGLTIKPDLNTKPKVVRPSTSKYSNESSNFFHSRDDKQGNYSSTKKFSKEDSLRRPLNNTQY